jgi:tetratricopeptide (TPR) repeat protein
MMHHINYRLRISGLLSVVLCLGINLFAQNLSVDSLKLALKNAKHDTTRCYILNALVETENDENTWIDYNTQLLKLSEKNALSKDFKSLYLNYLAIAYNNVGSVYDSKGDIANALEYYHKSLKIREEIQDKAGIAICFNNIAFIYSNPENYTEALNYNHKSLKIQKEINDKDGIARTLNNIGFIYWSQQNFNKALEFYNQSLVIEEEIANKDGISSILSNMGTICYSMGDYDRAFTFYHKSLLIDKETGNKAGLASSLVNEGNVLLKQHKIDMALEDAKLSLKITKELGHSETMANAASLLKKIYKEQHKFKEAFDMYELEIQMRDSINNEETRKATLKRQFQYEYEKQAAADSVKHAEEQKVKNAQLFAQEASLKQEKTQRYALYGGLLLVIGFCVFVFNRFKVTQKQKKIIEEQKVLVDAAFESLNEKNKEVMDSITYARRIQQALITPEIYIDKALNKLNKNA